MIDGFDELREPRGGRNYIVVVFWGVETERKFYRSKRYALRKANEAAAQGADVHVAAVLAESRAEADT